MKVKSLSRVQLLSTPWSAAHQASLSVGLSRQEYWSGVPLPSPIYKELSLMSHSIVHKNTFFCTILVHTEFSKKCKYIENSKDHCDVCLELYQEPSTILDVHLEDCVINSIATCGVRYCVSHQYRSLLISLSFQLSPLKGFHLTFKHFLYSLYSK